MPTKQCHFFSVSFFFFFCYLIMAKLVTDINGRTILKTKLNLLQENENNTEGPKVYSNLNCTIKQLHYIILRKFMVATFVTTLRQSTVSEREKMDLVGPPLTVDHIIKLCQMLWSQNNRLQLCLVQGKLIPRKYFLHLRVFGATEMLFK